MRNKYFYYFLIVLVQMSCLKDEYIYTDIEIVPEPPVTFVNSSIQGVVYDAWGKPMSNVEVSIGPEKQLTNPRGRYCFADISLAQTGNIIRLNKPGLVESYSFIKPVTNELLSLKSSMIAPTGTYKFNSSDEIVITFGNDGSIEIPANAFETERGTEVNDAINMESIYYEDVCHTNCYPVNLDINTLKQQRLQTDMIFGIIARSARNNERLRLKGNYDITINFPSHLKVDNDTRLFKYDKNSLRWDENNDATAINSRKYVLNALPDFVALGSAVEYSWITGELRDYFGTQHYKNYVIFTFDQTGAFDHVESSSSGYFQVAWPKGKPFVFQIVNECGKAVLTEGHGAVYDDIHPLEDIQLAKRGPYAYLRGSVETTDSDEIKRGLVKVIPEFGFPYYAKIDEENGKYSTYLQTCRNDNFDMRFYDLNEMLFSEQNNISIERGRPIINSGAMTEMSDYIMIEMGEEIYLLEDPKLVETNEGLWLEYTPSVENNMEGKMSLHIPVPDMGNAGVGSLFFTSFDENHYEVSLNSNKKGNGNIGFNISEQPDDGRNIWKGEIQISDYTDYKGKKYDIYVKFAVKI